MNAELNPANLADIQTLIESVGSWFYFAGVVTGLAFAPIFFSGIRELFDLYRNRRAR